jgi:lysyl-tRNA synthetase class 2
LNDPLDQLDRFVRNASGPPAATAISRSPTTSLRVRALEYGMAPTAGGGLGVDRLLMVLTDVESVREVVPIPTLRTR